MTKFKIGDMVKVVNYGSPISSEVAAMLGLISLPIIEEGWVDEDKYLVGKTGIVTEAKMVNGRSTYALEGPNKVAWYDDGQLELIYRPEYPAEEIV